MKSDMEKTVAPLKALKDLFTTGFAVGGMIAAARQIIDVASKALKAYAENEKAVVQLNIALANNSRVTADTSRNLIAFADSMSRTLGVEDEAILAQAEYLASLNLTEIQIKEVLRASLNMSASGVIPLEGAVRGLAATLSGTVGQFGRLFPAVRDLTEEQLRHGAAIDLVAGAYRGMGEASAQTVLGIQARWKVLIGEQFEKIGKVLAPEFARGAQAAMPYIDQVGDALAKVTLALVRLGEGVGLWFKFSYVTFSNFIKIMVDIVGTVAKLIWAPLEVWFGDVIYRIKTAFVNVINWLIDQTEAMLQRIGTGLKKLTGGVLGGGMAGLQLGGIALPKPPEEGRTIMGEWGRILKEFADRAEKMGEEEAKLIKQMLALLKPAGAFAPPARLGLATEAAGPSAAEIRATIDAMGGTAWGVEVATRAATEASLAAAKEAFESGAYGVPGGAGGGQTGGMPQWLVGLLEALGSGLKWVTAQLGSLALQGITSLFNLLMASEPVKAALEAFNQALGPLIDTLGRALVPIVQQLADWIVALVETLKPFITVIMQVVQQLLAALQPVFDALLPVVAAVGQIFAQLAPVVSLVVRLIAGPLATGLKIVAPILNVFAGLLDALMPIIEILAKALDILSRPVEIVALIFGWLMQKLIAFGTMIIYIITFQWGKLKNINWGQTIGELGASIADVLTRPLVDLGMAGVPEAAAGGTAAGGGANLGSTTTIQRAPDIYIYQYFQAPIIGVGGMQEVGEFMADALRRFVGIGGRIHIIEGLAPVTG
jgi:phage-related protein